MVYLYIQYELPIIPAQTVQRPVKSWRTDLHLTQQELAQQVGVTGGFLAHVETGRTMPAVKTCKKLAHALGVDEMVMLRLAGIVSDDDGRQSDEELLDPELRVFFRDAWPRMSDAKKELMRDLMWALGKRVIDTKPEDQCIRQGAG